MSALRDRNFRRLLAGQSLSTFGDTAMYLTLGMWAKDLTGSNAAAGGVFLALGVPAFAAPLAGHLADRVRRRPLMIATNTVMATVVLALLAVRSADQLWILYGVAVCYGMAWNILGAAGAGLRASMLAADDLAGANALLQTVSQGFRIVAPLAGAGLYAAFGGGFVAVLDVATFGAAIAALAALRITEPAPEPRGSSSAQLREAAAGFRHVFAVPVLRQLTIATGCAFAVLGLGETVIFAVISDGLHRPSSFFGVANSVQGAGSIAAGLLVVLVMKRVGETRVVGLSLASFALAAGAYLVADVPLVLLGAALDGIGSVWLTVAAVTAAQRLSPGPLQGRVSAALSMAMTAPQTLSIAAGTALIGFVDYHWLLAAMAALVGVSALWLLVRPAEPGAEVGVTPLTSSRRSSTMAV